MDEITKAWYKIVGLVDKFDEQHNIVGQHPIGSVVALPVEHGDAEVEAGRAEVAEAPADETTEDETGETGTTGEDETGETGETDPTGETGEADEDEDDDTTEDEVE
jgi:hypothetical protein